MKHKTGIQYGEFSSIFISNRFANQKFRSELHDVVHRAAFSGTSDHSTACPPSFTKCIHQFFHQNCCTAHCFAGQTRRDTHTQAHDDDLSLISHNFDTPKICRVHAVRVRVSVRVRDKCLFARSALFSPRGSAFLVGLGG